VQLARCGVDVVGGDHDRDQRVVQGFINVGHMLGVLGEPIAGGDNTEADPMGGYVAEQAAQGGAVHAHARVADINEFVGHPQPETLHGERNLRALMLHVALRLIAGRGGDADVGDGGQVARRPILGAHDG
jgi:hypothetical protein